MSSPSSARISNSNAKIPRATKKDINSSASRSSRAFGASSVSNSSRKVAGAQGQTSTSSQSARVYLDGVDVTPQSLLVSRIKPSSAHDHRGNKAKAVAKGARGRANNASSAGGNSVVGASLILGESHSVSSLDNDNGDESPAHPTSARGNQQTAPAPSPAPKAPVKAVPPVSQPPPPSTVELDEDGNVGPEVDGMESLGGETKAMASSRAAEVEMQTARNLLHKMPRRPITIKFAETPTIILYELRSVCVGLDSNQHQAIVARNKQYQESCAAKKGSDKYVEGRSQTLQLAQKAKEVMTAPPATRDVACVATDWDIFDCAKIEEDTGNEHEEGTVDALANAKSKSSLEGDNSDVLLKRQVDEIVDATMASPGCVLDVDGDIVEDLKARQQALRSKKTRHHNNASSLSNSQKSRLLQGSAPQSTQDIGRSTANVLTSSSSNNSMPSPSQSGVNVAFGASQDGHEDGSGNSSAQNSAVGLSTASHGVLSGGDSSGDESKQNAYARANTNVDIGEIIAQQKTSKVLASQSLLKMVSVVERAVQQNVYHAKHVLYRNFPSLTRESDLGPKVGTHGELNWRHGSVGSVSSPVVPPFTSLPGSRTSKGALEKLWTFECELTAGRSVSCLTWNTVNEDLLAVSYVQAPDSSSQTPGSPLNNNQVNTTSSGDDASSFHGLVLFWSLKNPEFPERIYNLKVGVTSIDFSRTHPYLVAVGFADGVVAIYDTRKDDSHSANPDKSSTAMPGASIAGRPTLATALGGVKMYEPAPIATSETSNGKHLDAVWQVKWISKGSDRGENVVSISSDGRVTEWSMKKGLSFSDLMTLKRVANPLLGSESRADGVISRQASGHCIDFAKNDASVYFVGTEDGMIHKCSVSYNEQYLQTYYGHTGPVYQILVSPFCNDLFLSASGDWNIKLWHQSEPKEVLNFRSVDLAHAVHGISWCPSDATIFGAVTEDGRIEIWDLQQSILDPIITHFPKKFVKAAASSNSSSADSNGVNGGANGKDNQASSSQLDDLDGPISPTALTKDASGAQLDDAPQEVKLECTKLAFAPSAPVIVVGDSTGDVTIYRVPTLAEGRCDGMSADDQVARLLRAMNPNKHV